MELELPKQFNWTEEDENEVNKIQDNATWLFKYFIIGLACGVVILLLLKLIDWWGLFNLTGVFYG